MPNSTTLGHGTGEGRGKGEWIVAEVTLDAVRELLLRLTPWAEFCRGFAADKKTWILSAGQETRRYIGFWEVKIPTGRKQPTRMGHPVVNRSS